MCDGKRNESDQVDGIKNKPHGQTNKHEIDDSLVVNIVAKVLVIAPWGGQS